jgi:uncharacterized protein DUF4190/uncharacterized protein DUF1707
VGVGPDAPHDLRASDADRESAVGRLRVAAMEGRLDAEELAERVTTAYQAKWCGELERLTADVTPAAVPAHHPVGAPVFVRPVKTTNALAIASLILGFVWAAWLGSILAVVLGHAALRQIRASRGRQTGKGLAIGGLALGYFGLFTLSLTIFEALVY